MSNVISFTANLKSGDGSNLSAFGNGYLGYTEGTDTIWYERGTNTGNSGDYYILEINAATSSSDLTLETFDLEITWDDQAFEIVDTSDFEISDNFQFFNAVDLNAYNKTARITAGSSSTFNGGEGVTVDGGQTFRILLQVDNDEINRYSGANWGYYNDRNETVSFEVAVNSFDSVLTSGSGSTFETQGATGSATFTFDAKEKVSALQFTRGDIEMDTDRTTGTSDSTKIIRQGDTVFNEGGPALYLDNFYGAADSTGLTYEVGSNQDGISVAIAGTGSGFDFEDYNQDEEDQYLEKGQQIEIDLVMEVDTSVAAGTVINSANFWASAEDIQNGDTASISFGEDKSLVTYASDLNLDGRVSMVDLAYLNSGAGDGNYARDVDVNFDGLISIADLEAMDDQFGSSLHTSNPLTGPGSSVFIFTGNGGAEIALFEGDGEYGGVHSDDAFIDQNILENDAGFDYLDRTALLTDNSSGFSGTFDDNTFNDSIEVGTY